MEYTKGIKALLSANAAINSTVGTKIYPVQAPSGTAIPYITYEVMNTDVEHSKDKAEHITARIEVVGYTTTYADACTMHTNLKAALARQSYNSGGITIDKVFIQEEEIEYFESPDRYAVVMEVKAFVPL
jgi:hypothetical protein